MVSSADKITYIKVTSELESLLLESFLIKKYRPKYNVLLKDDKQALYIVVTNEKFPRLLACRKLDAASYKYVYGPFPNSGNVKIIIKLLRKIFPFSDHLPGKKPCLYSHLGLCNPCPNKIQAIDNKTKALIEYRKYMQNIKNLKQILSGKFNQVKKKLERKMNLLSANEKYEQAAEIRNRIKALDYITQKRIEETDFIKNPNLTEDLRSLEIKNLANLLTKYVTNCKTLDRIECFDISHLSGSYATASMVVALKGEMNHQYYKHFKIRQKNSQSDYDNMKEIAKRRLEHINDWGRPNLIIVDGGLGQVKIFAKEFQNTDVCIVGIAKNPDRLVFINGVKIKLQGPSMQLVSRIRDEAHRFARRYHHLLVNKNLLN